MSGSDGGEAGAKYRQYGGAPGSTVGPIGMVGQSVELGLEALIPRNYNIFSIRFLKLEQIYTLDGVL